MKYHALFVVLKKDKIKNGFQLQIIGGALWVITLPTSLLPITFKNSLKPSRTDVVPV